MCAAKSDWRRAEANRRTRIAREVPAHIREWLHRLTRVHALLKQAVNVYEAPAAVGGSSSVYGDTYAARAARGDQTLLYDFLTEAVDQLHAIRFDINTAIDAEKAAVVRVLR